MPWPVSCYIVWLASYASDIVLALSYKEQGKLKMWEMGNREADNWCVPGWGNVRSYKGQCKMDEEGKWKINTKDKHFNTNYLTVCIIYIDIKLLFWHNRLWYWGETIMCLFRKGHYVWMMCSDLKRNYPTFFFVISVSVGFHRLLSSSLCICELLCASITSLREIFTEWPCSVFCDNRTFPLIYSAVDPTI